MKLEESLLNDNFTFAHERDKLSNRPVGSRPDLSTEFVAQFPSLQPTNNMRNGHTVCDCTNKSKQCCCDVDQGHSRIVNAQCSPWAELQSDDGRTRSAMWRPMQRNPLLLLHAYRSSSLQSYRFTPSLRPISFRSHGLAGIST